MKSKLFLFSLLIISGFVFSACSLKNQSQLNINDALPLEDKIEINQKTGDETETELLNQIDADKDTNFDTEFKNLDSELSQ